MWLLSSLIGNGAKVLQERPFQLLFLSNILPPLGTALLSPVLGSLVEPLGTTTANVGLVMSAFTAPAIIGIPIVGIAADRFGRRPVIILGLLCFGATGSAIALTTNFRVVLLLRICQGIGFAALTPIIITSIGDLYTGTKEVTAQGLRFTGSGISQTVFPIGAGIIAGAAWQYPFLLYAVAFPVAAIVYLYFEEPARSEAENPNEKSVSYQLQKLRRLVTQRRAWTTVIARGTPNIVWIGFLTYNSILVTDVLGGTTTEAGLLAALGSLSYATAATQAGRVSNHFSNQVYLLVGMHISMAAGLGIVFIAWRLAVALLGVTIMGIGFGLSLSLYRSMITELAPSSSRGGLVSLAESGGRLTSTVTPIMMGTAIAVLTSWLGFAASVRVVGVSIGLLASTIGVIALLLASLSTPIQHAG